MGKGSPEGCYYPSGRGCRGCSGWFKDVDGAKVVEMAGEYTNDEEGQLVKGNGNGRVVHFPYCDPIEAQVRIEMTEPK